MDDDQQFCLRWNNHQSTLISVFDTLLENGTLVDCTLAAEGKFLKAHKVVLCACSPYFASLLSQQYDKHPIFILKDVKFQELRAMMDYMYRGEVNISQDQLAALLKAAESLQIKGLSDNRSGSSAKGVDSAQQKQQVPVSGGAAGSAAKTGLTIEQNNKRPNAELLGDREGSTSPSSRKRKRARRRSVDTNNPAATIDNHDQMSNSSSQSATQAQPITSTPLTLSQITTATSAANVLNVTKKTDQNSNDDDDDDDDEEEEEQPTMVRHKTRNTDGSNKDKIDTELLIEPKSEYEDGNDEAVEDLTEELIDDLEQAGPSHGGEGSSQGYAQWQVDRSQDDVYLTTQESAGQHRDAQGELNQTIICLR